MSEQPKRRALGRGLEELFNIEDISYGKLEEKIMETAKDEEIKELPLDEIRPNPYQPRKTFDEEKLQELANSITEYGVFQPIIVKRSIKGYEIIAGERRYRASKLAGKTTIPAIIRDFTDNQMMEIAILENLQRENLNAIEEALAYKSLQTTYNLNQEELAKKVGKSRSHITNMLGLLSLPEHTKELVISNKITMGHARALSKLEDQDKINALADKISNEDLSVREIEEISKQQEYKKKNKISTSSLSNEYLDLQNNLSEYLGTKVTITKNKLEIKYTNKNDLNRILDIINYKQD